MFLKIWVTRSSFQPSSSSPYLQLNLTQIFNEHHHLQPSSSSSSPHKLQTQNLTKIIIIIIPT
ncbi:hypothetical protein HanHA89_Chr08g0296811 [Helianthus annuus]|nr:hypothetical protein HanHA89_Chr08g0296811 [Helianthus annuus]